MTLYCYVEDDQIIEGPKELPVQFSPDNGTTQMLNFDKVESPAQYGWLPFIETNIIPEYDAVYERLAGSYVVVDGSYVTNEFTVESLDSDQLVTMFNNLKMNMVSQVSIKFNSIIQAGFAYNFGTEQTPDIQYMQCRNEMDRTNWLALKDACVDAIAAGLGNQTSMIPIRVTSNAMYVRTYNEIVIILTGLRSWVANIQGTAWAKTDAINATTTIEELLAISTQDGWPD